MAALSVKEKRALITRIRLQTWESVDLKRSKPDDWWEVWGIPIVRWAPKHLRPLTGGLYLEWENGQITRSIEGTGWLDEMEDYLDGKYDGA